MTSKVKQIQDKIDKYKNEQLKANINLDSHQNKNIDALDKELTELITEYKNQIKSSVVVDSSNVKEHKNFYVADFNDQGYYTKDHIAPKGQFKDATKRAMNITIGDGGYHYDETSCSQACKKHKYFGLQDGGNNGPSQCFCSDSWAETTQYGTDSCGRFGGAWCNYVYENVKPPPMPPVHHLGKLYYAEKKVNDKKYTIIEYPKNQIDYTGQTNNTSVKFYKIPGFNSAPSRSPDQNGLIPELNISSNQNEITSKQFYTLDEAKSFALEIGAVGFVYNKSNDTYYFKRSIFPQVKKVPDPNSTIYLAIPAIKNAPDCNKNVEVVTPNFINKNCNIKTGIPPSNICDGLNVSAETGLGSINERLESMGRFLVSQMKDKMNNVNKYDDLQPAKREKYNKTLDEYEKVISVIKNRKNDIITEDAISHDALKNVEMRKMFALLIVVIVGTAVIIYFLRSSKFLLIAMLSLFYFLLYYVVVSKDT